MEIDSKLIIGTIIALSTAIVVLSGAIGLLWRAHNTQNKINNKKFEKIDQELKDALKNVCVRGGGWPRWCIDNCEHVKKNNHKES